MQPGDVLDGEGGYTVYGRLVRARESLERGCLPMGLTSNARLVRPVKRDALVTYADVDLDHGLFSYKLRRTMEKEAQKKG